METGGSELSQKPPQWGGGGMGVGGELSPGGQKPSLAAAFHNTD